MYTTFSICLYVCFNFLIKQSKSLEINNENGLNNNLLTSKCIFDINIKPPIVKKLECRFKFDDPNDGIVDVTINNITIMGEMQKQCPSFSLKLFYLNRETPVQALCANKIGYKSKKLENFTSGRLVYDNKGLHDTTTAISITVELRNQKSCDETKMVYWPIIAALLFLIILLIVVVIVIKHVKDQKQRKKKGDGFLVMEYETLPEDRYKFPVVNVVKRVKRQKQKQKRRYGPPAKELECETLPGGRMKGYIPTDPYEPEEDKHVGIKDPTTAKLA